MNRYPAARACPFDPPEPYARWRAAAPATRVVLPSGAAAWLVTRYDDVRRLLRHPALVSDSTHPGYPRFGAAVEVPPLNRTFIGLDGAAHRRLRQMFADEFSVPAVSRLEPRLTAIVDACLDNLSGDPVDLVAGFALPVASRVICDVLGLGYAAHERFERGTHVLTDRASTDPQKAAAGAAIVELVADLVRDRRRRPRDDLASRIVTRYVATGELTEPEAVHNLALVLGAGHHTSANMLALSVAVLLREPAWADRFRAEPDLRGNAVEELLRYLTIVQLGLARVATADIPVGDQLVRAGDGVVLSLLTANRDAERFADPDRLDLARSDARHHVAFGFGPHQCVGHWMARRTVHIALAQLFTRLPALRLAGDDLPFTEATDFHGLQRLLVHPKGPAMTQAERNKEIVRTCYEQFFVHRRLDALAEFVHEKFVQHSPDAPSGRDAYLAHLREAAFAGGTSDIKRILADGDYVAVHHHMTLRGDDGPGLAVVDLWRLEDGKLAEHWDVEQPVPDPSKVPNGMF